jgi:HAD superfamily hydrolase (TIGR01509 family)
VLIDSLAQDYAVVGPLLEPYFGAGVAVAPEVIRRHFALSVDDYWVAVTADAGLVLPDGALADLVDRHKTLRRDTTPVVHAGVVEILAAAADVGLRRAVVSNNPAVEVQRMLAACGLLPFFDTVVGNDEPGLARKPAPDPYLAAARRFELPPADCVAIEDSVLGLESAHRAGCHVVGVATGADSYDALDSSGFADQVYPEFALVVRAG